MNLTQKYLKEILDYNPLTGIFRWKVPFNRENKIGQIAGCKNQRDYLQISINKKALELFGIYACLNQI